MSRLLDNEATIEVTVIFLDHETDLAYKIQDPMTNEEHWIPFSQTLERHRDKTGHGTIVITEWIAKKKRLI